MPELPEVETIRRYLRDGKPDQPSLLGWQVTGAQVLWERTLATPGPESFTRRITGQHVRDFGRRGKFLLVHLDRDTLILHLRMSGDIIVEPDDAPIAPHHRLILSFHTGLRMAFNDTRKFGRAWLVDDITDVLGALGPEPLDPALTPEVFHARLAARRRQLKPLLLDQSFLAGMGNIYTDEALHRARLHPLALSSRVQPEQSARLLAEIREVLAEGIRRHGASIDWVYRGGEFQTTFRVYRRTGAPCPVCGTPVQRLLVGQRSTHICPNCQALVDPQT